MLYGCCVRGVSVLCESCVSVLWGVFFVRMLCECCVSVVLVMCACCVRIVVEVRLPLGLFERKIMINKNNYMNAIRKCLMRPLDLFTANT